jgi:uncharacterized membrane protein YjdF
MGFGDFTSICHKATIPLCTLVGPLNPISNTSSILPTCYARSIELANTIIFETAVDFMHLTALGMTVIMILHVRSKFTAVGRKEITTFFYIYMFLTIFSLILDAGVVAAGPTGVYPYLVAIQSGLTSALCTCLLINGFVGFQIYEDGTTLSVWLLRLSSLGMFVISFAVSLMTFKGWAGLGPTNTVGLFVVLYIINGICILVYLIMQVFLVVNTLQDRWPLGDIAFGVFFFIVGQVLLYIFSDRICDRVQHYLDGLFFATICNLLAVMMVYKVCLITSFHYSCLCSFPHPTKSLPLIFLDNQYWDSITREDLEFSVGTRQSNWDVKEALLDDPPAFGHERRPSMYEGSTESASSLYQQGSQRHSQGFIGGGAGGGRYDGY